MLTVGRAGLLVSAAISLAVACSAKNGSKTGGGNGSSANGACDGVQAHVRAIYETEPAAKDVTPEAQAELVAANVHMVLKDCESNPAPFMKCIKAARTIEELEKSCLIPLDDEGTVEGKQFR